MLSLSGATSLCRYVPTEGAPASVALSLRTCGPPAPQGQVLAYYEDLGAANKKKPKGQVSIVRVAHLGVGGCAGLDEEKSSRAFGFDTKENKSFVVYADTMAEKLQWMRVLCRACGQAHDEVSIEERYKSLLEPDGGGGGGVTEIAEAAALIRGGRHAPAAEKLEESLSKLEGTDERACAFHQLGKARCELRDYAAAHEAFGQAAALAPAECATQLQLQLAWCLWQRGCHDEAAALYAEVLEHDPLCCHALLDRSRMHLGVGRWAEALADLKMVIALDCESADIHNDVGVCYFELDRYAKALAAFDASIGAKSDYAPAYANRGNCRKKQGAESYGDALSDYTRAIELDSRNPKAYNNRGALLLKMGKYAPAIADFELALELDPAYEAAERNRAIAKERLTGGGITVTLTPAAFTRGANIQ